MTYKLLMNGNDIPAGYLFDESGEYTEKQAKHAVLCGKLNPTGEEIAKTQKENADFTAATEYKAQRVVAYPSIQDQLDLLYHGGMDAWKAAITAVKEEFPK